MLSWKWTECTKKHNYYTIFLLNLNNMDRHNNPYLGNSSNSNPPKDDPDQNSELAANLVRAKLASLYGDDSQPQPAAQPQPEPQQPVVEQPTPEPAVFRPYQSTQTQASTHQSPHQNDSSHKDFQTFKIPHGNTHSPATGMLYEREQSLQQSIDHVDHVAQPDHELPPPNTHFELPQAQSAFTLPQVSTPRPQTSRPHVEPPVPQPSIQQPVVNEDQFAAPTISQQLNPEGQMHSAATSRDSAIKNFTKQAEKLRATKKDKLKFWKRQRHKTPTQKKNPMYKTAIITALVLVLYNNQLISGQINYYISPGDAVVSPQIIDPSANNTVGAEPEVIIPKINVQVPTVYGVETRNDDVIQDYLEQGVVHYARTALPGQVGNTVILGHSSNSFWNGGQHKNAFSLLDRLEIGDTYMIHFEGKRYVYEIFNKEVIEPTEFRVVSQETNGLPISTLITCTPPGTSWKRLVIQAEQISPDPLEAEEADIELTPEDQEIIGGNTRSLWDNLRDWLFD